MNNSPSLIQLDYLLLHSKTWKWLHHVCSRSFWFLPFIIHFWIDCHPMISFIIISQLSRYSLLISAFSIRSMLSSNVLKPRFYKRMGRYLLSLVLLELIHLQLQNLFLWNLRMLQRYLHHLWNGCFYCVSILQWFVCFKKRPVIWDFPWFSIFIWSWAKSNNSMIWSCARETTTLVFQFLHFFLISM